MMMMRINVLVVLLILSILSLSICKKRFNTNVIKKGKYSYIDDDDDIDIDNNDNDNDDINNKSKPFEEIASYLLRNSNTNTNNDYDFSKYHVNEITAAVAKLAASQAAVKSLDGATHQFRNILKDSSSLSARYDKFMEGDQSNLKEASKVLEYILTVERALQATEILSALKCIDDDEKRVKALKDAGLKELKRVSLRHNKLRCSLSILSPIPIIKQQNDTSIKKNKKDSISEEEIRFQYGELVIGIVDEGDDDADIAQVLRMMSQKPEFMPLRSTGLVREEVTIQPTILKLASDVLAHLHDYIKPTSSTNSTLNEIQEPQSLRIVGHSAGGAVAAYVSMVLEGSLNITENAQKKAKVLFEPYNGVYNKRVSCMALGPPPCISRIIVPRFITSIICGDDIIPRASFDSIEHMKERSWKALEAGAGKGALGWMMNTGWVTDITSVASKSLGLYTGQAHDLSSLSVPGRVFFIKSRKHKLGASIQRVMRGNWQEDVLWLLHEIYLSKRMIEHHSIASHFRTLARC